MKDDKPQTKCCIAVFAAHGMRDDGFVYGAADWVGCERACSREELDAIVTACHAVAATTSFQMVRRTTTRN